MSTKQCYDSQHHSEVSKSITANPSGCLFQKFSIKNNLLVEKSSSKNQSKISSSSTHSATSPQPNSSSVINTFCNIPKPVRQLPEEVIEHVKSKLNINKVSFSQLVAQKLETLQQSGQVLPKHATGSPISSKLEKPKKMRRLLVSALPAHIQQPQQQQLPESNTTQPHEKLRLAYILN